jgi:Domain of unknown function (DUF1905)/Bacteriocin-protection, YdeI or OmpD-Associated
MQKPLVNKKFKLQKFPGKGGWTYAAVPEIKPNKQNPFGWVRVQGFIDDYEIKQYHLMPMGNGHLFLPVKAAIRKKIKKQEGDWVKVVLYLDESAVEIPDELLECLRDEPKAHQQFFKLSDSEQKQFIDWIYSAKKEETKIERMAEAINRVAKGQKFSS